LSEGIIEVAYRMVPAVRNTESTRPWGVRGVNERFNHLGEHDTCSHGGT